MRCRACSQRDARKREYVSHQSAAGTERRGAAYLPKHIAIRTAIYDPHAGVARRRQRAADLEYKNGVRITLGIESQCPGQLS